MRKDKSCDHGNPAKPTHYQPDSYCDPTDTLFFFFPRHLLFCFVFLTATSWSPTPTSKNKSFFKSHPLPCQEMLFIMNCCHFTKSIHCPPFTCKLKNTLPFELSMYNPQVKKKLRLKSRIGGNKANYFLKLMLPIQPLDMCVLCALRTHAGN